MGTKTFKISFYRGNANIKLSDRRVKKQLSYLKENQRKTLLHFLEYINSNKKFDCESIIRSFIMLNYMMKNGHKV